MLIVVFFTALFVAPSTFADIKTVCGYVLVQKQCKKRDACANHFWLDTDKGKVTVVPETWLISVERRLMEVDTHQRVLRNGSAHSQRPRHQRGNGHLLIAATRLMPCGDEPERVRESRLLSLLANAPPHYVTISREGDRLYVEQLDASRPDKLDLVPRSEMDFSVQSTETGIRLEKNREGRGVRTLDSTGAG